MTLEIEFRTVQQVEIAQALWQAETQEDVDTLLEFYGREGHVVHQMITAAHLDTIQDLDLSLAEQVIAHIRQKSV